MKNHSQSLTLKIYKLYLKITFENIENIRFKTLFNHHNEDLKSP